MGVQDHAFGDGNTACDLGRPCFAIFLSGKEISPTPMPEVVESLDPHWCAGLTRTPRFAMDRTGI